MVSRWCLASAVLLAAAVGCGGQTATKGDAEHEAEGEAEVVVKAEPARRGSVSESIAGLGRVEALPDHLATLTPAVEGHVHALSAKEGDAVRKGQPIVEFDRAAALADFAEKSSIRDALKASLALLKSLPRAEEQRPLKLAVEQARVGLDRAQRLADEVKKLETSKLASSQQVFDAEKALDTARLQLETAESQFKIQMIGPRPEAVAEAQAKIKTADAAVEFSKAHLDFHTIRAPINGVLDSLTCHPGQTIAIGATIGEVVDSRQVHALVWLPPRSARGVKAGLGAQVRPADEHAASESTAKDDALAGKVDFVGRVTDPQTGNLPVRILVDNEAGRLALGQIVQVSIGRETRTDVLQVPAAAILDLGEGMTLMVVREGKAVVLHPKLGVASDGWVEVSDTDLKPGELVIVEGGYGLPEKTPVKVEEPGKAAAADDEKDREKPRDGEQEKPANEKSEKNNKRAEIAAQAGAAR